MKNKNLFQLIDSDNENLGLISTDAPEEKLQELYNKFYHGEKLEKFSEEEQEDLSQDMSADSFVEVLERYGYIAERIFADEIYPKKTNNK